MRKYLDLIYAIVGWFAVITQFFLMMENRVTSLPEMTLRFFSFFTILTNSLVAIYFSFQALIGSRKPNHLFNRAGTLTAITVYITVVGLVYQVVLRQIWQPTGMQMVVDELLHTFIPVFVIVYWVKFELKSGLRWELLPRILIFPLIYVTFILLRGEVSGFYPYPFIDVVALGWTRTLVNVVILMAVFVTLSSLFIALGRRLRSSEE